MSVLSAVVMLLLITPMGRAAEEVEVTVFGAVPNDDIDDFHTVCVDGGGRGLLHPTQTGLDQAM